MKQFKQNRDLQSQNNRELKKFLNYALKRDPPGQMPQVLFRETPTHTHIIEGEADIKEAEREITAAHIRLPEEDRPFLHDSVSQTRLDIFLISMSLIEFGFDNPANMRAWSEATAPKMPGGGWPSGPARSPCRPPCRGCLRCFGLRQVGR